MILKVINMRRIQQWFCKCFPGRRCFKQRSGNFAATSLSLLQLCLQEIQIILSLCLHWVAAEWQPSLLSEDTRRCKHPWTNLPWESCPVLTAEWNTRLRKTQHLAQGLGVLLNRQRAEISAKGLNLPWKCYATRFQKQKQDRDKKVQLHPSYK